MIGERELVDSGVDWIGHVPQHWHVFPLKTVAYSNRELHDPGHWDLPYVGLEHVASWTGNLTGQQHSGDVSGSAQMVFGGQVLFGKLRPYLAKVWIADSQVLASTEFLVLQPSDLLDFKYLHYLLRSKDFVDLVDSSTFGAKMPRASWSFIGSVRIPVPPIHEQEAIADFLDAFDERVNRYVAAKRRMIELLEEKKQAIIN